MLKILFKLLVIWGLSLSVYGTVWAGSIFITGHDPTWHSNFGGNQIGARNLATAGISYARNGSTQKFLFIESITTSVPSGNARTAPFLQTQLGFSAADYDIMDGAALNSLVDFRSTLNNYSAIVVASDHGGMLTAAELGFLNNNSANIIDYLNAGGGLYAEAQSNAKGLIGSLDRFGFLPFLVSSTDFQSAETTNTVTTFGQSLGLADADVNGNFSHNFFSSTGGMTPVDLFNDDPNRALTLAFRGQIDDTGVVVVPIPASIWLFGTGLLGLISFTRKKLN